MKKLLIDSIISILFAGILFACLSFLEDLRWIYGFLIGTALSESMWSYWLGKKRVARCVVISILLSLLLTTIDSETVRIWEEIRFSFWIGIAVGFVTSIGRNGPENTASP